MGRQLLAFGFLADAVFFTRQEEWLQQGSLTAFGIKKKQEKIKTHRFPANSAERLPVGLLLFAVLPDNQSSTSINLEAAFLERLAA